VKGWVRKLVGLVAGREAAKPATTDPWLAEDFQAAEAPLAAPDPWATPPVLPHQVSPEPAIPAQAPRQQSRAEAGAQGAFVFTPPPPREAEPPPPPPPRQDADDGWDADDFTVPEAPAAPAPERPPTGTDIDLPEYDPQLSQRLGSEDWAETTPPRTRARARAAAIAALLEINSRAELTASLSWLEDFFLRRDASSTYRAIERAALEGLDFPTLRAMDALRQYWEERPEYWVYRTPFSRTFASTTGTMSLANGPSSLTWVTARLVCLARADWPPEDMIDPDWLDEWFALPRGQQTPISFAQFVGDRVTYDMAYLLDEGLAARAQADDPTEWCDPVGWERHIPEALGGYGLSLRMVDVTGTRQVRKDDDDG
jgi:hypothetical protein